MKINDKILSLPPYISTSWSYVKSIQMKGPFLVIILIGGETINIPNLKSETVEQIFSAHASYLEKSTEIQSHSFGQSMMSAENGELPFKFGIGSMDGMGNPLMHNPAQKDAPDIPKPILQKIAAIAKIISPEDMVSMPKAEPHCNCLHCQIVRTISSVVEPESLLKEEQIELIKHEDVVNDDELNFQQWEIFQTGDKMFNVTNRLDTQEKYSVYLGYPVGCTCGKSSCEHIVAVLKS